MAPLLSPGNPLLRWTLALLLVMLASITQASVLTHTQAMYAPGSMDAPPSTATLWQTQTLPDRWRESHPQYNGVGWYRLALDRSQLGPGVQAIYLPHASINATVYLNGQEIGRAGPVTEPMARTWSHPRLYLLPPDLLRAHTNIVDIRVVGHPYAQASLYPPHIGAEAVLRAEYEQAYFLRITLNQIATLLISAVSVLMFSLWWRRKKDMAYGYLALSAMVWSLQSTNLFILQPPVATAAWEIFVNASFQVFSALLLLSMLRFVGLAWRPLNLALGISCLVSPLAMALIGPAHFLQLTTFFHMVTLLETVVVLAMLSWAGLRRGHSDARLLLLVLGAIVLFALHDWLLHSKHLVPIHWLQWMPHDMYLLQYSAPFVFLAIGWIMTVRFVRVLNEFEALTQELDQRVRAKSVELEESYTRLHALERERAVQEERERIHSDLHDDVGAKLLTLVYRAPSAEHADLARAALQDLRDVVSSPSTPNPALEDLLADWRSECEQRLSSAGLALQWQQADTLDGLTLSAQQGVNLGRILRESVSNILRHAQARQVQVVLERKAQILHLHVIDDGNTPAQTLQRQGRGTRNMQARARALGGQFARFPEPPAGCHVHVCLPITPSP